MFCDMSLVYHLLIASTLTYRMMTLEVYVHIYLFQATVTFLIYVWIWDTYASKPAAPGGQRVYNPPTVRVVQRLELQIDDVRLN
jgi:hypothetical protein